MSDENDIRGVGVYAPEVLDFVRSANEYCNWMESEDLQSSVDFIRSAIQYTSRVYANAVMIEEFEPMMEGENEKFVTEQQWSAVYQKVLSRLGQHHSYLRIAESGEFDRSDLVTHTISEDLADIFQDLKDFIMQYRQGIEEMMNDSVWEVMSSFEQYWSEKLLSSLHALNRLYIKKVDPESAEFEEGSEGNSDTPKYDNSFFTRLQDSNEEEV